MNYLDSFPDIWLVDFEFHAPPGERPEPICLVAREHRSGETIRLWGDALTATKEPPFAVGDDALFVAYYASAELGCFLALDWSMPTRILDLYAEFRCLTSGLVVPCGRGLIGALSSYGIDGIDAADKSEMRDLAIRGGPFTDHEMQALVDYCETDVDALEKLLPAMKQRLDVPRALMRGRYMAAAARMEWTGTPIDAEMLVQLRESWPTIKGRLIAEVDADYHCFVATGTTLDPSTPLGAAIIREAAEWGIDPYVLAEALQILRRENREAHRKSEDATIGARKTTGLTPARITRNEPALLRQAAEWVATDSAAGIVRPLSFSAARFAAFLSRADIPWPHLPSGALDLSDDAFRQMSRQYPVVAALRELRHALSQMRLNELAVGSDGRNRCLLSAFASRTGRNQPSNSKFIFGPSVWLRALIQPAPGRAVAYIDWCQQEFGIAAALSGDQAMTEAYTSGDPYLSFAKQAGAVPEHGTKETHKAERERFKVCALAVQYGMAERSLAASLGQPEICARNLLQLHRETYPRFWRWSQAAVDRAMLHGYLETVFGWRVHVGTDVNPRSLANFPMQANGAEMLRLACCLATERGIEVCAPVHDALLIEAAVETIDQAVADCASAMKEASEVVLDGFALRTDAMIVRHPGRYSDPRGERMWELVSGLLATQGHGVPFQTQQRTPVGHPVHLIS